MEKSVRLNVVQGSEEWLAWREDRSVITAFSSEAPAVMDVSRFAPKNRRELRLVKLGLVPRSGFKAAMDYGNKQEPIVRARMEEKTGLHFGPVVAQSECGRFAASYDGISLCETVAVEIKCPYSGVTGDLWGSVALGVVPDYYHWQLVQQAALAPSLKQILFVVAPRGSDLLEVIPLDADELRKDWVDTLKPRTIEFLESLKSGRDPGEYADEAFQLAALELDQVEAEFKEVKARYEAASQRLLEAAPKDISVYGGGFQVIVSNRSGTVDYKKLLEDLGVTEETLAKYRGKGKSVRSVSRVKS